MTRIGIAGSGQAGLATATGLLELGVDVDVFTPHTTEELMGDAARLTQLTFPSVGAIERRAGLDFWPTEAPVFSSIELTMASGQAPPSSFTAHLRGPNGLTRYGTAIDHRAKTAAWLQAVENKGGRPRIQTVTPNELAWFATSGMYDLFIVATGDRDDKLAPLFAHNPTRSTGAARRIVIQAHFEGSLPEGADVRVVTTPFGEVFAYPVLTANGSPTNPGVYPATCVQIFARPGGPLDPRLMISGRDHARVLWEGDESGPSPAERALARFAPDIAAWCATTARVPRSELLRPVLPAVRQAVTTIKGTPVVGIGDAVLTVDPTSAQGAHASTLVAATIVDQIRQCLHQQRRLADTHFLQTTHDQFWHTHGQHTGVFGELVNDFWGGSLDPAVAAQFARAATEPAIADRIATGWDNPATFQEWLLPT